MLLRHGISHYQNRRCLSFLLYAEYVRKRIGSELPVVYVISIRGIELDSRLMQVL